MASRTDVQVVVTAKDLASDTLSGIGKTAGRVGDAFQKATVPSALLAGALAVVGTAATKSASEMEQNRVAFETLLGSQEKAAKLMKQLSDTARTTPFELPNIVNAARQLLAYGSTAEDVIPEVRMLGDISGGNAERFSQLALAFGQVRAKTRLAGQEMLQFTNAGVGLRDELSKRLGVAISEVDKKMEKGEITFEDVRAVLKSMTSEGGKFFGMMDKQSKTFGGVVSNIKDNIGRLMRGIIGIDEAGQIREGSIFAVLTEGAQAFLKILNEMTPRIIAAVDAFSQNKVAVFILAGALVGALTPALIAATGAAISFIVALAPFVLLGAAIAAAIAGLAFLWNNNFLGMRDTTLSLVNVVLGIPAKVQEIFNSVVATLNYFRDNWQKVLTEDLPRLAGEFTAKTIIAIGKLILLFYTLPSLLSKAIWDNREALLNTGRQLAEAYIQIFFQAIKKIEQFFRDLPKNLVNIWKAEFKALGNFFGGATSVFKKELGFATGGVVPGPIGAPVPIIAHGGEEVKPTGVGGRNDSGGGSGFNVVVNIGTMIASDTERRNFAELLMQDLENIASMKGKKLSGI